MRFISVDPLIQDITSSQSFNSYAYCMNNPLKYSDPSGYVIRRPEEPYEFFDWSCYYNYGYRTTPGGGNGGMCNYGRPGEGRNGTGLGGIYYDWVSGMYRSVDNGQEVSLGEFNMVIDKYADLKVTTLYYVGSKADPYKTFKGFDLSDGTKVRISDLSGQGNDPTKSDLIERVNGIPLDVANASTFIGLCGMGFSVISKVTTRIGITAGILNIYGTYYIATSDGHLSWGEKARLGVAGLEAIGTNCGNPYIMGGSLLFTIFDASGGLDGWYSAWDMSEKIYQESGTTVLPIYIPQYNWMPVIHK